MTVTLTLCTKTLARTFALALCLTALLWVADQHQAAAHGSADHIMGTVNSVTDTQLDITTKNGKQMTIQLNDKTKFEARGKQTTGARPQTGDRVVVDLAGKDDPKTAAQVLFSTPPKGGAEKADKTKH